MIHLDRRRVMWGFVVAFAFGAAPSPTQGPTAPPPAVIPARVEQVEFLRTAKVLRSRQLSSGARARGASH